MEQYNKYIWNTPHTNKMLSIAQIIEQLPDLDTDPPYQRGEVWKSKFQKDLICALINDVPINTLHFVKKSNKEPHLRYVLDGKQRINTIKSFTNNEFAIQYKDELNNKVYNNIMWKDLNNISHKCHGLLTQFKESQVTTVIWDEMNMENQRSLFEQVNHAYALNVDEKLYCSNYLTKKCLHSLMINYYVVLNHI